MDHRRPACLHHRIGQFRPSWEKLMKTLSKTFLPTAIVLAATLAIPGLAAAQTATTSAKSPAVLTDAGLDAKVIARRGADDPSPRGGHDDGANHT